VLSQYLLALAVTLAVEVPLVTLALAGLWRVPLRRAVTAAVAVNLATHPVLWWSLVPWTDRPWYAFAVLTAEVLACLVEFALLARLLVTDRRLLAVLCVGVNAASLAAGLLIAGPLMASPLMAAGNA
jgi:hypothetical protein